MKNKPHHEIDLDASELTIAVVTSRYHDSITDRLRDGAVEAFTEAGGDPARIIHVDSPGTFELPVLCQAICVNRGAHAPDAVVAIGCVIAGETTHDQHINQAVSTSLCSLSTRTGIPIAFGVITCNDATQAEARAGGSRGNKGREAMRAAIDTVMSIRSIQSPARQTT